MIINYLTTQFSENNGAYYSPAFRQDSKDNIITVAIELAVTGNVSMQTSLDEINWFNVDGTTFVCSPSGLQTFVDCQWELIYRIKTDQVVVNAKIVI